MARVLVLVGLLVLAYWIGARQGLLSPHRAARTDVSPSARGVELPIACSDAFPAAGTLYGGPRWPQDTARQSKTVFSNRTAADRVVDLLVGDQLLASVAVPAHADVVVALPVGAFDWRLRTGAAWCDNGRRFVREQRTVISPPIEIVASSRLTVEIAPDPDHPTGFALQTRDAPVVTAVATDTAPGAGADGADGVLRLPRSADGHYFVDGAVDGEPVRFMIDTGATRIALPTTLALRLGYYQGREVTVQTAGGQATGSEFKVRRISFGPFVAEDVTVVALMNLETPLLGMSLLQSIDLRQTAQGLELRRAR
jgi:aspartyl protease family protein